MCSGNFDEATEPDGRQIEFRNRLAESPEARQFLAASNQNSLVRAIDSFERLGATIVGAGHLLDRDFARFPFDLPIAIRSS